MSRGRIVTLTTDFGDEGFYVGEMRGTILSLYPDAVLVDITHGITPYTALEASIVLGEACRTFPPGTVHLAVVDPGVGGVRKPLIVVSEGYFFVGPDNGIFTPFLDKAEGIYRIRDEVGLPGESSTFHGRDLFAPAAARLAGGERVETLGEASHQAVRLDVPRPRVGAGVVEGQVLYADHFGNLITNIRRGDLGTLGGNLEVTIGTYRIRRLTSTYQEGSLGESVALIGSSGFLEVAVVQGNAEAQLGVGKGERVRVRVLERV